MRNFHIRSIPILAIALLWSGVSVGQQPVLPRMSPTEQMVNEANRALRDLEIRQHQENRLQFEVNTLRAQQMRDQQFPRLLTPPAYPGCPPSGPGC